MTLFTMKMTDADIKILSYGFYEWLDANELAGDEYEKHHQPSLFNEYAEYLMNEEEMDDDELMTNMYAVVWYYGDEGYVFQDWYVERTVNSAYCVEYEEWKEQQEEQKKQKQKEEKCIVPDCYEYGIIEWKAMDGNVCRECCLRINKKFEC